MHLDLIICRYLDWKQERKAFFAVSLQVFSRKRCLTSTTLIHSHITAVNVLFLVNLMLA